MCFVSTLHLCADSNIHKMKSGQEVIIKHDDALDDTQFQSIINAICYKIDKFWKLET